MLINKLSFLAIMFYDSRFNLIEKAKYTVD